MAAEGEALSVAFICTGNRFRSPIAAALLAREATAPVNVVSLGTLRLGAVPALPEAVELAQRQGLDLSAHRARTVHEVDLEPFDLVLGFELAHMSTAVIDGGAREGHTFLLPEIVSLLETAPLAPDGVGPVERARARIAQAARLRGMPSAELELPDPLGRSARAQRKIAGQLEALVRELSQRLFA